MEGKLSGPGYPIVFLFISGTNTIRKKEKTSDTGKETVSIGRQTKSKAIHTEVEEKPDIS